MGWLVAATDISGGRQRGRMCALEPFLWVNKRELGRRGLNMHLLTYSAYCNYLLAIPHIGVVTKYLLDNNYFLFFAKRRYNLFSINPIPPSHCAKPRGGSYSTATKTNLIDLTEKFHTWSIGNAVVLVVKSIIVTWRWDISIFSVFAYLTSFASGRFKFWQG